ncbi:transcription factor bhlh100 [Phtheirospermum japonicum]|uniref:Transcription factor bhlh100 n=1 Tax=Phtheirospermum japonicum TaxID=374723 RepID=A0A830CW04_9LAMI|nr:transcription factor bhlh100 [Phtheirospermum japonicum]
MMKITTPNSKNTRKKRSKSNIKENADEKEGPSNPKKLNHNAKERIRRMKLNASYLALRALLPDTRRSKKRWSAPAIVDKVLKYIPELENEIEELRSNKENAQSAAAGAKSEIKNINNAGSLYQNSTISINKVSEYEAIVQICMPIREDGSSSFVNMLRCVEEDEGICIKSASTIFVCETRISYHLHIQVT